MLIKMPKPASYGSNNNGVDKENFNHQETSNAGPRPVGPGPAGPFLAQRNTGIEVERYICF